MLARRVESAGSAFISPISAVRSCSSSHTATSRRATSTHLQHVLRLAARGGQLAVRRRDEPEVAGDVRVAGRLDEHVDPAVPGPRHRLVHRRDALDRRPVRPPDQPLGLEPRVRPGEPQVDHQLDRRAVAGPAVGHLRRSRGTRWCSTARPTRDPARPARTPDRPPRGTAPARREPTTRSGRAGRGRGRRPGRSGRPRTGRCAPRRAGGCRASCSLVEREGQPLTAPAMANEPPENRWTSRYSTRTGVAYRIEKAASLP